jgi:(acyl-carrier-protein) S-malonyltransferase
LHVHYILIIRHLSYLKAIRLVKVRGEAMQLASEIIPSGMMTVFYGPDSKLGYACLQAREWCLQRGIEDPECSVASYLYPECKVIAGHLEVQY